jgi:GDP-4-dehydro-6-deoxy-D-mannose reductase
VRALVTGVAGFVGGHLVDYLRAERPGVEILGLDSRPGPRARALRLEVIGADIQDEAAVRDAIGHVRPDAIVHLAAQSSPQKSWEEPAATVRTNVLGILNLLEGARAHGLRPRVLAVGSAEEYGQVRPADLPVREDAPLRPLTPYAASKVAQGFVAQQYALSSDIPVMRTRTFHHTGPRRGESFAESSFARQLAEIEAGRRAPVIEVGNLDSVRDFSDVRDVVRAYWGLVEKGRSGEVYNVCSGTGVRMRDLLQMLIEASGLQVEVRVDPERLRPSDVPELVGDPGHIRAAIGWAPRIPLERSLGDLLDHWRERVAQAPVASTVPGA